MGVDGGCVSGGGGDFLDVTGSPSPKDEPASNAAGAERAGPIDITNCFAGSPFSPSPRQTCAPPPACTRLSAPQQQHVLVGHQCGERPATSGEAAEVEALLARLRQLNCAPPPASGAAAGIIPAVTARDLDATGARTQPCSTVSLATDFTPQSGEAVGSVRVCAHTAHAARSARAGEPAKPTMAVALPARSLPAASAAAHLHAEAAQPASQPSQDAQRELFGTMHARGGGRLSPPRTPAPCCDSAGAGSNASPASTQGSPQSASSPASAWQPRRREDSAGRLIRHELEGTEALADSNGGVTGYSSADRDGWGDGAGSERLNESNGGANGHGGADHGGWGDGDGAGDGNGGDDAQSEGVSTVSSAQRYGRNYWTNEEEEALRRAMKKHANGRYKWADIKADPEFSVSLGSRANTDLCNKAASLEKAEKRMAASAQRLAHARRRADEAGSPARAGAASAIGPSEHTPLMAGRSPSLAGRTPLPSTSRATGDSGGRAQAGSSCRRTRRGGWTAAEESALLAGVERYGPGKWKPLLMDRELGPVLCEKTAAQCSSKYRDLRERVGLGSAAKVRSCDDGSGWAAEGSMSPVPAPEPLAAEQVEAREAQPATQPRAPQRPLAAAPSMPFAPPPSAPQLPAPQPALPTPHRAPAAAPSTPSAPPPSAPQQPALPTPHRAPQASAPAALPAHTAACTPCAPPPSRAPPAGDAEETEDGRRLAKTIGVDLRRLPAEKRYLGFVDALVDAAAARPSGTKRGEMMRADVRTWLQRNPSHSPVPPDELCKYEIDHIIPEHLGGHHHPRNYFLLEKSANGRFKCYFDREKEKIIGKRVFKKASAFAVECRDKAAATKSSDCTTTG